MKVTTEGFIKVLFGHEKLKLKNENSGVGIKTF